MDLSILIVNWNSAHYARLCIESIRSHTRELDYEIIVVDNASTDESCGILREWFPNLQLICSSDNLGFARANNLGFEHCSGRNVLFLNPDTELRGPAIERMYSSLESSPSLGIVGCKLLNTDLSIQTSCIQPYPTILNQIADAERLRQLFPRLNLWSIQPLFDDGGAGAVEVDMVSGACLMVKRQVLQQIGLFDPGYFMYAEDLDLCYRARQAGWKVGYVGSATLVHHGGQSSKKKGGEDFSAPMMKETLFRFFQKTRGTPYAWLYRAAMLVTAVIRVSILEALRAVPSPWYGKEPWRSSLAKWQKILRWAVGLEPWTRHAHRPRTGTSSVGPGGGASSLGILPGSTRPHVRSKGL